MLSRGAINMDALGTTVPGSGACTGGWNAQRLGGWSRERRGEKGRRTERVRKMRLGDII